MSERDKRRTDRVPVRLRARIAILVSTFSLIMFVLVAMGGWLLVLEAEDAILEASLEEALRTATHPHRLSSPEWYREYATSLELMDQMQLDRIPKDPGVYELFANAKGDEAIWVYNWTSRLSMWFSEDREREFRLLMEPDGASLRYRLIDLSHFEFTESRVGAIQRSILIAAVLMGLAALVLSYIIGRWTLHPVLRLAAEVNRRKHDQNSSKIGGKFSDDEIGFLAQALDEADSRARAAIERERHFISDCSHELRTPVATLKSSLTLVEELNDDPAHRARVESRMRRAVGRMERLVRLFLVLAREGRRPAEEGLVSLRPLVDEILVEQARLNFPRIMNQEVDVSEGSFVQASRDVVMVLIQNFVANIWQHAGASRLRIRWEGEAVLLIEDDGSGFPVNEEDEPPSEAAGFGIGLSLSERLCRLQGWSVTRGQSDLGGAKVEIRFGPR